MNSQQTIGRYEVLAELGHGAMGTVYRAKDPAMGRIVALKTIRPEILSGHLGGELRERFYREARAAGALAHPGIVPVFDVGEHDGTPFLVMEFINGRTLADWAKGGERFPIERVCEIGQQIAEALGYAHKNGVVHRDIKAANVLLTSRESYGIERPKITDFGVAKLASAQITTTGQMLGTPAYMPPEQFTGGAIDGRSDLFSLGVILYWMTTGEYPFPGETITAISYKVMHTEPLPPRKLNPAVPEPLSRVILKCLAKSPADRYQTGEELARDLAAVRAAGMATTAVRGSAPDKPSAASDPHATLDRLPSETVPLPPDQEPPIVRPALATAVGTKKENVVLVLVIAALVIAVAGLYVLQSRDRTNGVAPVATAPVVAPLPTAVAPTAAAPTPSAPPASAPAPTSRPAAVAATKPPAAPAAAVSSAAGPADAAPRGAGTIDFDPLKLNPNENARLRVDIQQMAPTAELILVMDGKVYIRRSVAEFKEKNDDLYLPPGVHEFRVRARNGQLLKISNIASADFQAKKRQTLRIELRVPPAQRGAALTPQEIAAAARVFVSLR
jgi:serine/threonine protein kinase